MIPASACPRQRERAPVLSSPRRIQAHGTRSPRAFLSSQAAMGGGSAGDDSPNPNVARDEARALRVKGGQLRTRAHQLRLKADGRRDETRTEVCNLRDQAHRLRDQAHTFRVESLALPTGDERKLELDAQAKEIDAQADKIDAQADKIDAQADKIDAHAKEIDAQADRNGHDLLVPQELHDFVRALPAFFNLADESNDGQLLVPTERLEVGTDTDAIHVFELPEGLSFMFMNDSRRQLYVRRATRELLSKIEEHRKRCNEGAMGVVVNGNPGIGKSYSLNYLTAV